jgi:hypothetical protein
MMWRCIIVTNTTTEAPAKSAQSTPLTSTNVKSRIMRWAGYVARMGEGRGMYRVLVGKSEGKRPLGRPRRRWEDNIRMDLQEMGCGCEDWIGLAQDRDRWLALVSAVMNLAANQLASQEGLCSME